jgi:hypothetical protein
MSVVCTKANRSGWAKVFLRPTILLAFATAVINQMAEMLFGFACIAYAIEIKYRSKCYDKQPSSMFAVYDKDDSAVGRSIHFVQLFWLHLLPLV